MIRKQFGQKLRKLRKNITGLSQEDFANKIDMDRTYYSSVENGERNISLLNIKKISDGLGLTISELFIDIEKEDVTDLWGKKN